MIVDLGKASEVARLRRCEQTVHRQDWTRDRVRQIKMRKKQGEMRLKVEDKVARLSTLCSVRSSAELGLHWLTERLVRERDTVEMGIDLQVNIFAILLCRLSIAIIVFCMGSPTNSFLPIK